MVVESSEMFAKVLEKLGRFQENGGGRHFARQKGVGEWQEEETNV